MQSLIKRSLLVLALLLAGAAGAQTYVELILDASGSMWNKLEDDRYRIVAAKDVLTQFVGGLPDGDLNVGLRIYGSQQDALSEGACDDTELFVPLAGLDKASLSQTVQAANALGATPIAKSLLAAADDFPADAQRRLIILVTDGEESCGGDLQAVAEDLRDRGFEIDIRIIGFDLDAAAVESFAGVGTFENAENAEELAKALETAVEDVVVEEVEVTNDCEVPASLNVPAEVEASYPFEIGFEGPEGLVSLHPVGGDEYSGLEAAYSGDDNTAEFTAPGEQGSYEVRYTASKGNCVVATGTLLVVPIQVTLTPPAEVEASYTFDVGFEGPEGYIGVYAPGAEDGYNHSESYHYTKWSNPAELLAPATAGDYDIRYYDSNGNLLASVGITVLEGQATLSSPESVEASFTFEVPFEGPTGWIGIYTLDAAGKDDDLSSHYSNWGNPAEVLAPAEPGSYEMRYYDEDNNLIASKAIVVTGSQAGLEVPASVEASYEFLVPYDGPAGWIGVYTLDAAGKDDNISDHYSNWGNPAELKAPAEPGDYEVRYYDENNELITSAALVVAASQATMSPPTEIEAGSTFAVPYEGPAGWIGVYEVDAAGKNDDIGAAYSNWGNPAIIGVPVEVGTYEVRYYDELDNLVLSMPITVTPSTASLELPATVTAGADFVVPYTGPLGWIGVYETTAAGRNDDISDHFTNWGNPAELTAPDAPGSYELRYYATPENTQEGLLLSVPLTVQ